MIIRINIHVSALLQMLLKNILHIAMGLSHSWKSHLRKLSTALGLLLKHGAKVRLAIMLSYEAGKMCELVVAMLNAIMLRFYDGM